MARRDTGSEEIPREARCALRRRGRATSNIEVVDRQIEELNKLEAAQMQEHQAAVVWLIEVPGIWAIAHRLCRIAWNISQHGARFIEHGKSINPKALQRCIDHHLKVLRRLGYQISAAATRSHWRDDFRRSGGFT